MRTVLVFGASGAVGGFLLPLLGEHHYKVSAVSRSSRDDWLRGDLYDASAVWPASDVVISLGPLDGFAAWLERQATPPRRAIALSSMSAESKRESTDAGERDVAARLRNAESRVLEVGARRGIVCTIFRPTLIYGAGSDRSLAPIARFMRRWRVLPVPFGATGLRQPVHAADLATACVAVIDNALTAGRVYALGGGERLTFAQLLYRLRDSTPGFVLPLPLPLLALHMLSKLRRNRAMSAAAVMRLREPLLADNRAAAGDFGYAPRAFVAAEVLPQASAAPAAGPAIAR